MICIDRRAANFSILLSIILPFLRQLSGYCRSAVIKSATTLTPTLHKVSDITLPAGYSRIDGRDSSFARWLRQLPLKSDNKVYLYNGSLKANQDAQYAVLDITHWQKRPAAVCRCRDAPAGRILLPPGAV